MTAAARCRLLNEPFPSASPTKGAFLIAGVLVTRTGDEDEDEDDMRTRSELVAGKYLI